MRAGYFKCSKELLMGDYWPEIESKLNEVFKEVCRKEIGNGLIEIHGESELFDPQPEGASGEYECSYSSAKGGQITFKSI